VNNSILIAGLCITGAIVAAAGISAFLIAPEKASKEKRAAFSKRNYAHRGLHEADKNPPENSLPAFAAAAELGYGVELDVHLTRDGELAVFHDDNLKRVCGLESVIEDLSWDELKELKLFGTQFGMPLLSQVLDIMGENCPVIIELKRGSRNTELCEKTYETMKKYGGKYCVESFDPRIVAWFRHNAPEILRGQLAKDPKEMLKDTSKINAFAVGNLLTNCLARPNFVAYGLGRKPLLARLCEKMGAMKVAWVAHDGSSEKDNDAVIFEFYRPSIKY